VPAVRIPASFLAATVLALATPAVADVLPVSAPIAAAVANSPRPDAERARDVYRHPGETLTFFEVTPTQTVVELYPGGGWYTRILAPLLKAKGHYIAAVPAGSKGAAAFATMLKDNEATFGKTTLVAYDLKAGGDLAPAGTVDRVLTFRNIHNLIMSGTGPDGDAPAFFAAAFRALKKGGVLGIVDHRLPEQADAAREKESGYLKMSTVARLAMAAGFTLTGSTEINANPKDTADWPKGVWTLPPTLELGDVDRAKYLAIGESDRMTLRFVKH
jgi:predicted methyltransferase